MYIECSIKISYIVEDLRRFVYFHIFGLGIASVNKKWIWQAHWLDLIGINLSSKNYQNIPNGSKVMLIFADQGQVDKRTDRRTHKLTDRRIHNAIFIIQDIYTRSIDTKKKKL